MVHDVFVSHSAKDKATADAVCAHLEAEGIRCWIAPRDILPGLDWGEAIVDAIEGCRLMVLIFSSHANTSTQIKREVERAVHKGKIIIPFRIEDVTPGKSLEYFISTSHWLDALTAPLGKHIAHLPAIIRSLLNEPEYFDPSSQPKSENSGMAAQREEKKGFGFRYPSFSFPRIILAITALVLVLVLGMYLYHDRERMPENQEAAPNQLLYPQSPEIPDVTSVDGMLPIPALQAAGEQSDNENAQWSGMLDEARRLRYKGMVPEALKAYSRYQDQFGEVYPSTKQYITTVQSFTLQQDTLEIPGGIYIFEIMPGSLAERIGLAVGDVIYNYAGFEVYSNKSYTSLGSKIKSGTMVQIDYLRMDPTGLFLKKHAGLSHGVLGVRLMDF